VDAGVPAEAGEPSSLQLDIARAVGRALTHGDLESLLELLPDPQDAWNVGLALHRLADDIMAHAREQADLMGGTEARASSETTSSALVREAPLLDMDDEEVAF
jgi:hypothetical protein